jgi:cobalt/nickel transport system ATP-binding protein
MSWVFPDITARAKMSQALIQLTNIDYTTTNGRQLFDKLHFALYEGERIGLIAPNGSGKTTLFHMIMGLVKPAAGSIRILGRSLTTEKDFAAVRTHIGLLFQDADDQLFNPTVLDDVAFGPLNLGQSREQAIATATQTLASLGMETFAERVTFQLSGGEKRMVALATILAMQPQVLLLDEPSAGLDEQTKMHLIQVLNDLQTNYVVVSHEYDFIEEITEKIYSIRDGRIVYDSHDHVHRHVHAHPYGQQPHKHR